MDEKNDCLNIDKESFIDVERLFSTYNFPIEKPINGEPIELIKKKHINTSCIVNDKYLLICYENDTTIYCYNIQSVKLHNTFSGNDGGNIYELCSYSNNSFLSCHHTGVINYWNLSSERPDHKFTIGQLDRNKSFGGVVCIVDDEGFLCSDDNSNILFFSITEKVEKIKFIKHQNPIRSIAILSEKYFISGDSKVIFLWKLDKDYYGDITQPERIFEEHSGYISYLKKVDDEHFLSGSADGDIRYWNAKTGDCLKTFKGHCRRQNILSIFLFSNDFFVSCSKDNTVLFWNLEKTTPLYTIETGRNPIQKFFIINDFFYTLGSKGTITGYPICEEHAAWKKVKQEINERFSDCKIINSGKLFISKSLHEKLMKLLKNKYPKKLMIDYDYELYEKNINLLDDFFSFLKTRDGLQLILKFDHSFLELDNYKKKESKFFNKLNQVLEDNSSLDVVQFINGEKVFLLDEFYAAFIKKFINEEDNKLSKEKNIIVSKPTGNTSDSEINKEKFCLPISRELDKLGTSRDAKKNLQWPHSKQPNRSAIVQNDASSFFNNNHVMGKDDVKRFKYHINIIQWHNDELVNSLDSLFAKNDRGEYSSDDSCLIEEIKNICKTAADGYQHVMDIFESFKNQPTSFSRKSFLANAIADHKIKISDEVKKFNEEYTSKLNSLEDFRKNHLNYLLDMLLKVWQGDNVKELIDKIIKDKRLLKNHLKHLKTIIHQNKPYPPRIFISYSWGIKSIENHVQKKVAKNLKQAGFDVLLDIWANKTGDTSKFIQYINNPQNVSYKYGEQLGERPHRAEYVLVMCSPDLLEKWNNKISNGESRSVIEEGSKKEKQYKGHVLGEELKMIYKRVQDEKGSNQSVFAIIIKGEPEESKPDFLPEATASLNQANSQNYVKALFELIKSLAPGHENAIKNAYKAYLSEQAPNYSNEFEDNELLANISESFATP